jgi:hypothetical protein
MGEKPPDTPAQKRGKEVHAILEEYFKTGVIPQTHPLGYYRYVEWLVDAGILPVPGKEFIAAEHRIFLDTATGLPIGGYDDGEGVPLVGVVDAGAYDRVPMEIGDLKTTSDLRWAKTPAELQVDTQMNTYAQWAFGIDKDLEEVTVAHYYVKVDPPGKQAVKNPKSTKVLRVSTEISRAGALRTWQRDIAIMEQMKVAALVPSFEDLTPNINFCPSYGGCDFKPTCGIKASKTLFAINTPDKTKRKKTDMGFMDKIKTAEAVKASKEAPEEKTTTAAPVETEAPEEKKEAPKAAAKKNNFLANMKNKTVDVKKEAATTEAEAEASIVPPDGADRSTDESESEAIRAKAAAALEKKEAAKAAKAAKAADKAADKAAGKKTTPRKSKHKRELTIYIGCMPMKGEDQLFTMVEDWAAPIIAALNAQVLEHTEKQDYRLLGYSEEKTALADAIASAVKDGDPLPSALVSLNSGVGREIVTLLTPLATDIVGSVK